MIASKDTCWPFEIFEGGGEGLGGQKWGGIMAPAANAGRLRRNVWGKVGEVKNLV
jgi:hypothetical protein